MSHVRQQIREAAALAITGLSITAARVFQSRLRPLTDADLPCLLISTNSEQIQSDYASADGPLSRTLTLTVRGVAKATATLDDTLDSIAAEVETVLNSHRLGGLVKSFELQTINVEMDDALEKPVGIITLEFTTLYFTSPASPGTAL